jgi:membrane-bound lytic murein transglycosylase B
MRDPRYNKFVKAMLVLSLTALAAVNLYIYVIADISADQVADIRQPIEETSPPPLIIIIEEPAPKAKPRKIEAQKVSPAPVVKAKKAPAVPKNEPKNAKDLAIKKYAKETGVSPRLIDAILTVETGKGNNVGKPDMFWHIPWDQRLPLVGICSELGYRPNKVRLAPKGEMGPGQFQPKTWKSMKKDVANLMGKRTPNPWRFEDAAAATALYLDHLGAGTNEAEAVMRYNAGSKWRTHGKPYLAKVLAAKKKSKL